MTKKLCLSTRIVFAVLFLFGASTISSFLMGKMPYWERDLDFNVIGYFKPESFGATNATWLDNNNALDKIFYSRHTMDLIFKCAYGMETYGEKVIDLKVAARNKALWGAPGATVFTASTVIQELEAVGLSHQHAISLLLPWMREVWMEIDLGTMCSIPFENKHYLKLGAFSFTVGRGISLGDNYASGPGFLGFYTEDNIDQFAFGIKLGGDIVPSLLNYDLYIAFLQNRMYSYTVNAEKIRGQEFGKLDNPARGSGTMNFIAATRLQWWAFKSDLFGSLQLEPYFVFNHDPEQKVEFPADSSSKLGTIGFAGEYKNDRFEGGFDCAVNMGVQRVKGWDRNEIQKANFNGQVVLNNSHVLGVLGTNSDGSSITKNLPYIPGGAGQKLVNTAVRDQEYNGTVLGEVGSTYGYLDTILGGPMDVQNAKNRFRNPYNNVLDGWMFVLDGAYWVVPDKVRLAVEAGVASGDDNPNLETLDGKYSGFIGLQEVYSGNKVQSAFVLGGAGKIKRPFSQPRDDQEARFKNASASRFTNLVYGGTALIWKETSYKIPFQVNPNILLYWQEHAIGRVKDRLGVIRPARMFLGTEANIFFSCRLMKDLEGFFVTSFFFPGAHFKDRATVSLDQDELDFLNQADVTGFMDDRIPQLGSNAAYTFNIGLKYTF